MTHVCHMAALAVALFAPATASIAQPVRPPAAAHSSEAALTDAEVRKVDKAAARITLRHGEIKHLDMPAMTMVFSVKDAAMLEQVKAGDRVRFRAASQEGKFTVTEIQVVK